MDNSLTNGQLSKRFSVIEFYGIRGLYIENREDADNVPEGCYRYDFSHDENDWFSTLEQEVYENYCGSVFTKEPIEFPNVGYLSFDEKNSPDFLTKELTIEEFVAMDQAGLYPNRNMGGIS